MTTMRFFSTFACLVYLVVHINFRCASSAFKSVGVTSSPSSRTRTTPIVSFALDNSLLRDTRRSRHRRGVQQLFLASSYGNRNNHDREQTLEGAHGDSGDSFTMKKEFESRLAKIERMASSTLGGFYEPHLKSFSITPGTVDRLSVTSTCFALRAILAGNDDTYDSLIQLDVNSSGYNQNTTRTDTRIMVRSILMALLASEWREDDLFQVPLLLHTILSVVPPEERSPPVTEEYKKTASSLCRLIKATLDARPRRRAGTTQRYSDYILYLCTVAYAELHSSTDRGANRPNDSVGGLPEVCLPENAANDLALALSRCVEISNNELCRQLAFRYAGDYTEFDSTRLAYNLLTYVTSTSCLANTGWAGLELIPGEGPSPGTQINRANQNLIRAALRAFFEEQMDNGIWDKGQPIYKSFRRQGRDVGNAFVFSLDTLASLLKKLPAEEFRPYQDKLKRSLAWIEQHQTVDIIPDYCDPESGQCYGKPLRGWSSPHLSPGSLPQAWCTAQALSCVSHMRRQIRSLMNSDVLNMFDGKFYSEDGPADAYWDRLLDSDLGNCGFDRCRTLKSVLEERMIEPFEESVSNPGFGASYSSVLFGPPGTAKTTICESLARKLGWDFVVIDTSVFLADGLGNVAARIKYVFERLQALDKCVILFDEIEEFCLDRETPGIGMESRMLTTAMLTAINDLRRAERSLFFLATNRLRAFDSAITRPGRFDLQLFVGTPNLESRCIQFQEQLSKVATVDEETKDEAMEAYESFLSSKWNETAQFMNFLEGRQFASACADIVGSGNELTDESMGRLLDTQAAVMTVRGTTRDEFIASMGLSRL